ncbi:MAG: hypothetical protein H0W50_04965 [Parachlamydiaceae bacterium]|nr:hypothetical protein [Parachlamydiaceae bacterium]
MIRSNLSINNDENQQFNDLPKDQPRSIYQIPEECLFEIFRHLKTSNPAGFLAPSLVDNQWYRLTNKMLFESLLMKGYDWRRFAFGPQQWAKFFGEATPSDEEIQAAFSILPNNIHEILNRPCPVFLNSGKLIKDTHTLVYIPKYINETEFTLTTLGVKVESKLLQWQERKVPGYKYMLKENQGELKQNEPVNQPHWVLMPLGVLDNSKNISNLQKQTMVKNLVESSGSAYTIPKAIEAVAVTIANLVRIKEYLFGINTYILCEENIGAFQIIFGGSEPSGLTVTKSRSVHMVNIGASAIVRYV